jgi:hypothetical protein
MKADERNLENKANGVQNPLNLPTQLRPFPE